MQDVAEERDEELDEFDKYNQEQAVLNSCQDEFEHFTKSAPIQLPKGLSALDWWLQAANRAPYPSLSRMEIDILSIPAMSAEPERIFSGARRTITWSRYRLGADNVQRMECLKSWIRTGIVSEWRADLSVEDGEEEEGNSLYEL